MVATVGTIKPVTVHITKRVISAVTGRTRHDSGGPQMGNDKKDFNSAADPAHPSSTGRVGGRGGISTAAEGESRMPETPFDSVTNEGEDVDAKPRYGTHKEGVRK